MMSFLSPLALAWLASVGVLVWLWRYATSKHQIRVASLVPFAHLLRRRPSRRQRVVVNWLFWLQLACLVGIALALAQPVWMGRPTKTVLLVLDTSASMQATPLLARAKQRLLSHLHRLGPHDRVLLVTTAPVEAVTPEPTADASAVRQLLSAATAAPLGGRLSSAVRFGRVMLGTAPDQIVVATDEPVPDALPPSVIIESVGRPVPNVALLGLEAYEPLCLPVEPSESSPLFVTLHNFSDAAQPVTLEVRQQGRVLAQQRVPMEANQRLPLTLNLPADATGTVEVRVSASHDALAVDNRASIALRGEAPLSIAIASEDAAFVETIGRWLDACPRLQWHRLTGTESPASSRELLVTTQPDRAQRWAAPALLFAGRAARKIAPAAYWFAPTPHLITTYLQTLEPVSAAVTPLIAGDLGEPVLWALVKGTRVPLVIASQEQARRQASTQARRLVRCAIDPTAGPSSPSLVVLFLNSVRWLSGVSASEQVGNFFDAVESDTFARRSTWALEEVAAVAAPVPHLQPWPAAPWLIGLVLILLLIEWLIYVRRGRS
jgi:hypothetical protein